MMAISPEEIKQMNTAHPMGWSVFITVFTAGACFGWLIALLVWAIYV